MTVNELREKRAKAIADSRAILTVAEKDGNRPLTTEERASYDKVWSEVDGLKAQTDMLVRQEAAEAELAASPGPVALQRADAAVIPDQRQADRPAASRTVELRNSIVGDARRIHVAQTAESAAGVAAFNRYLHQGERASFNEVERRALQVDVSSSGGYLLAPQLFQAELIADLDNLTFMRQIARVLPPLGTAESLGAPSLDADPADPTWTAELAVGSEDSTMALGKRELRPHPLAQFIKVSKTLLRRSAVPVEALVRERLAYKAAVVEENAFLNGSGANQPLGVFTASANGISTGRDVSTGNTTTAITFDGLMECKYKLPAQWRGRGTWLFHRDAVKMIAKLKDGEGRYLWQPSVVAGQPDAILNLPVRESEYAPNTFTTGLYVGLLGDFRYYWIVDALTMTVQVLVELYAATNQNGYISRLEADGMPVLENAFARVKLA